MPKGMFIGELAEETGLNPKTIRYYEDIGLLTPALRTESGYRLYTDRDREILIFVAKAKAIGMSLEEIKEILDLRRGGESPCGYVRALVAEKLKEIDRRIADLQAFRKELQAYYDHLAELPEGTICGYVEGAALAQANRPRKPERKGIHEQAKY